MLATLLTAIGLVASCGPSGTAASRSTPGGSNSAGDSLLGSRDVVIDDRAAPASGAGGRWSVLLRTFSGEDALPQAAAFQNDVSRRYPVFRESFVEPRRNGAMVVIGRYEDPDDPLAQEMLALAKGITVGGGRPFATAMLVRRSTAPSATPPKPHDLRSLRARYPGRQEVYTLQVALWSTFGTSEISTADVQRLAERYVAQLRAQGYEAWFHHDPDSETSTVTVGSFGSDAYDPRSTLYAPEVERLMRAFPVHLVNGEEVLVPGDLRRADNALKPQGPRLVEVPFD